MYPTLYVVKKDERYGNSIGVRSMTRSKIAKQKTVLESFLMFRFRCDTYLRKFKPDSFSTLKYCFVLLLWRSYGVNLTRSRLNQISSFKMILRWTDYKQSLFVNKLNQSKNMNFKFEAKIVISSLVRKKVKFSCFTGLIFCSRRLWA